MKKMPYIAAMVLLVTLYLLGTDYFANNEFSNTVTVILAIVAAVAFWMEFKNNERVNEAQLIMELNNQFVTNPEFSKVEHELEKYYALYSELERTGEDVHQLKLGIDLSMQSAERQHLVNYLVHLEGVAALVNEGVLHLNVITDLMAYRYFIAVNNPVVQKMELLPFQDYYHGIFKIYDKWSRALGENKVPMGSCALPQAVSTKKQ